MQKIQNSFKSNSILPFVVILFVVLFRFHLFGPLLFGFLLLSDGRFIRCVGLYVAAGMRGTHAVAVVPADVTSAAVVVVPTFLRIQTLDLARWAVVWGKLADEVFLRLGKRLLTRTSRPPVWASAFFRLELNQTKEWNIEALNTKNELLRISLQKLDHKMNAIVRTDIPSNCC